MRLQEVLKDEHFDLVRSVDEMKGFSKNEGHSVYIQHGDGSDER